MKLSIEELKSYSYYDLVQLHPLFPITSVESETKAKEVVKDLFVVEDFYGLTEEQDNYLNTLLILLEKYHKDKKYSPYPDIWGVDLVKVLLKEHPSRLRQKDLISVFKTESTVSEVLNKKRKLTAEHIEKLAQFFKISTSAFYRKKY